MKCAFFFFLEESFKDSGKHCKFTTLELLGQKHYLSPLTQYTHTHLYICDMGKTCTQKRFPSWRVGQMKFRLMLP